MILKSLLLTGAALGLTADLLADTGIEDLAPANSFLIVSVRDADQTMDRLKATRLWDLWNAEEMSDFRDGFLEEFDTGIKEMMDELDLDQDSIAIPTGSAGMAMYSMVDPEIGQTMLGMLASIDYGDRIDQHVEFVMAAIDRGRDDGVIEVEQHDVLGHEVWSVTEIVEDDPAMPDDDMGMDFGLPIPGADMFAGMADGFRTMHLVVVGQSFLVSNDLPGLTAAMEAIEDDAGEGVANDETFQRIRDRLDSEADGYAVALTGNLGELMSGLGGAGGPNPMVMMSSQLKPLLGDIQGFGMDFRVGGETGMVEQHLTVYMPGGKRGLTELFNHAEARGDLPSFVGSDAISFGAVSFQTERLGDIFQNILNTTMLGMFIAEQREEVEGLIDQLMATVGNKGYTVTTLHRPISAESIGNVTAIQLRDEQGFENLVAEMTQGMLEPRDMLGRRIYDLDMGMMGMPGMAGTVSLGIGGGLLLAGPTQGVEDAIRSINDADGSSLGSRDEFRRAASAFSGEPVIGWGFSDTVDAMESQIVSQKQSALDQLDFIRDFDPDMATEMEADIEAQYEMYDQFDFDLLREYIGPSIWEIHLDDEGFSMRNVILDSGN